eukprot:87374-Lingulodinium_polyedra.AAC.1
MARCLSVCAPDPDVQYLELLQLIFVLVCHVLPCKRPICMHELEKAIPHPWHAVQCATSLWVANFSMPCHQAGPDTPQQAAKVLVPLAHHAAECTEASVERVPDGVLWRRP